ncbi:Hypothetical predicted protein [Pelobates cultripes]|uniref:Uncharacterized protein n=1 Tax=Pelobates cultripes TaxID=61616 RepID=A0AAD1RBF2_PELCU|nr:Hypothetical predicted protein [Pelobates cultripes]
MIGRTECPPQKQMPADADTLTPVPEVFGVKHVAVRSRAFALYPGTSSCKTAPDGRHGVQETQGMFYAGSLLTVSGCRMPLTQSRSCGDTNQESTIVWSRRGTPLSLEAQEIMMRVQDKKKTLQWLYQDYNVNRHSILRQLVPTLGIE